jgi:hypothetical protein
LGVLQIVSGGINSSSDNNEQMTVLMQLHSCLQTAQKQVSKTLHDKSSVVRFSMSVVVLFFCKEMCENGDIAAIPTRINTVYRPHIEHSTL